MRRPPANDRLRDLEVAGRLVEVDRLHDLPVTGVVEIDFGYGREYWAVSTPDYYIEPSRTIREGWLILLSGTPLRRAEPVREQGYEPAREIIRG
jgi:hypothetical protein